LVEIFEQILAGGWWMDGWMDGGKSHCKGLLSALAKEYLRKYSEHPKAGHLNTRNI
jgi:hypothetical protein